MTIITHCNICGTPLTTVFTERYDSAGLATPYRIRTDPCHKCYAEREAAASLTKNLNPYINVKVWKNALTIYAIATILLGLVLFSLNRS